jgi:hypothetical protein
MTIREKQLLPDGCAVINQRRFMRQLNLDFVGAWRSGAVLW